ncbi:MAG: HAD family hydrolase [Clostridiales bacterium]|nr:HAD family hydrolase [Clostridiales bacterium]
MSRKILFFDIDGTLFTPYPFSVPESTAAALKKARENGHLTFVNTGRTRSMIPEEIRALDFDGYVLGCGTRVYMHDRQLFFRTIPNLLCREVVDMARECRVAVTYEGGSRLLYDGANLARSAFMEEFLSAYPKEDLSAYGREESCVYTFDKFLVQLLPESHREKFRSFCESHFSILAHTEDVWEVVQKGCSKATGMEFLLKRLGISVEDSFAFGDGINDLPMLEYAGTGVAMGNASKDILPYCGYQTTPVDQDGIWNALEHFGLI